MKRIHKLEVPVSATSSIGLDESSQPINVEDDEEHTTWTILEPANAWPNNKLLSISDPDLAATALHHSISKPILPRSSIIDTDSLYSPVDAVTSSRSIISFDPSSRSRFPSGRLLQSPSPFGHLAHSTVSLSDFNLTATDPKNILSDLKSASVPSFSASDMDLLRSSKDALPLLSPNLMSSLSTTPTSFSTELTGLPKFSGIDVTTNLDDTTDGHLDLTSVLTSSPPKLRPPPETLRLTPSRPPPDPVRLIPAGADSLGILESSESVRLVPSKEVRLMPKTPISNTVGHLDFSTATAQVHLVPSFEPVMTAAHAPTQHPIRLNCSRSVTLGPQVVLPETVQKRHLMPAAYPPHKPEPPATIFLKPTSVVTSSPFVAVTIASSERKQPVLMPKPKAKKEKRKHVEPVSCFKCSLCGFLGLTAQKIEEHMDEEHDASDDQEDGDDFWIGVAKKEGISLSCPHCANTFTAESSRSFIVHVIDDHGIPEAEAEKQYKESNQERKKATLELMRRRREEERERKRRCRRDVLEAYVDDTGELRVRTVKRGKVDLSAKEYAEAMADKKKNGEAQKILPALADSRDTNGSEDEDDDLPSTSADSPPKRKRVGRPMGSRTLGLTKLGRLNPFIELSDEEMGAQCGVDGCAVRLKVAKNLEYHRKAHMDSKYVCHECQEMFDHWKPLALHLWRAHKIDMELFACGECEFKAYTQARLDDHKFSHKSDRPYLCSDCGKGFKSKKYLRNHSQTHHTGSILPDKRDIKGTCPICSRQFFELRILRQHIEQVHEKLRPHLCNFCGYSASNKSSLRLHLRGHTGDKPYACNVCEYRSSDHNSFRRHRMQHSGEKPYKCPYCPYSSIQSSTYKVHLKNKHPAEADRLVFKCNFCMYRTVKEGNFLSHMAEHKEHKEDTKESKVDPKPLQAGDEPKTTTSANSVAGTQT